MHLSILIETMRREGYEFQVCPPRVLFQEIDGQKCEPMERLVVDVPSDCVGAVIEKIGARKGDFLDMAPRGQHPIQAGRSWCPPAACSATATSS